MRTAVPTILLAALCTLPTSGADDIRAKTEDGRAVVLKDDSTWSFVEPAEGEKDKDAAFVYEGKRKTFALNLKPGAWVKDETPDNPDAEVTFEHVDGEVYGMVVAERIAMPLNVLKRIALQSMKETDEDAKVIHEEPRKVNGADVICLTVNLSMDGVPLTFHCYFYTGSAGSIQVATWTGQNLFDEMKPEMEGFLNGLVILKK